MVCSRSYLALLSGLFLDSSKYLFSRQQATLLSRTKYSLMGWGKLHFYTEED